MLLPLRSFTSQSEYGDELLQVLLDKTKAIYAELKAQPGLLSLESVKPYLSLLDLIAIIKKIANPAPLLRFYSLSLIGKMALQKLDVESQMDIIYRLSGILDICEENRFKDRNSESSQDLLTLRNMVVDASPHLLEVYSYITNHVIFSKFYILFVAFDKISKGWSETMEHVYIFDESLSSGQLEPRL